MNTCKACGDSFNEELRARIRSDRGEKLAAGELRYCLACADELFFDRIQTERARCFYPGPGSPGEPSDDASPGQENAIRAWEG